LLETLPYHPFLVKPNHHELGALFGVEITTKEDAVVYGKKLQEKGAGNVLVSMASEGAVLLDENGVYYESHAPKGVVKNSVGAGDSMVAGFLASYFETNDYKKAFYMSVSAGSASAFSEYLATKEEILGVYQKNFC
jgi:1-phosphofructokinase